MIDSAAGMPFPGRACRDTGVGALRYLQPPAGPGLPGVQPYMTPLGGAAPGPGRCDASRNPSMQDRSWGRRRAVGCREVLKHLEK